MKYLIMTLGVCLLIASVPAYAQSNDAIKQAVIKVDRAKTAASEKGDGEAWAKYVTDECRWTNLSTGEILQNKAQRAANITKRGPREPWKLSNEKFHIGETLVTQTGVTTASGEQWHFARIWTEQDGKWLMAAIYVDSVP